jgi:hypothetical protein
MQTDTIAQVIEQVQSWPIPMRIALARRILESVEREPEKPSASSLPRGPSAAEIAARFPADEPAPNDETVREWVDEHRRTKYGS